jgi:hypothetical protein
VLSGDPELSAFRDYLVVDLRERNEPGGPLLNITLASPASAGREAARARRLRKQAA